MPPDNPVLLLMQQRGLLVHSQSQIIAHPQPPSSTAGRGLLVYFWSPEKELNCMAVFRALGLYSIEIQPG